MKNNLIERDAVQIRNNILTKNFREAKRIFMLSDMDIIQFYDICRESFQRLYEVLSYPDSEGFQKFLENGANIEQDKKRSSKPKKARQLYVEK